MPPSSIPTVTRRAHLSLALLALVYIFSYIDRQVISILIEPIKREFGVSDTAMGMLTGLAFALLYAGLGVPVGKLADRGNRRNIVAVCCALWSVATLACGLVPRFWMLVIARMSVAIGEAGGMAPSIALVSDLYPKERRSLVITLFMMGPHLGVLIGLALGGWIAQQYGWRATFVWFGAPGMLLAALVWRLVREPRRGAFEAPAPADAGPSRMLALLAVPAFRNVCLACGVAGIAGYGYGVWTPSFLVRSHGMTIAHAGLVFGVTSGVGAIIGALLSGLLCDKLVRRDPRWQLGLPMLGVALCIPAALAFFLWPSGGYWMLGALKVPHPIAFAFIFALFASWWPALSYSATSHMVPAHQRSTAAATLNLFMTLFGLGIGPMAIGFLSDRFVPLYGQQGLRYALASAMCLMAFSVLLYGLAMTPYRARLALLARPVPNPL